MITIKNHGGFWCSHRIVEQRGPGEPAQMRRFARALAACIHKVMIDEDDHSGHHLDPWSRYIRRDGR